MAEARESSLEISEKESQEVEVKKDWKDFLNFENPEEEEYFTELMEEYDSNPRDKRYLDKVDRMLKDEALFFLYNKKMEDAKMSEITGLPEAAVTRWRHSKHLLIHKGEKEDSELSSQKRGNYHRTEREKDLVVSFVLKAMQTRNPLPYSKNSSQKPVSLRELLDRKD